MKRFIVTKLTRSVTCWATLVTELLDDDAPEGFR
jgi:hypothetical protein